MNTAIVIGSLILAGLSLVAAGCAGICVIIGALGDREPDSTADLDRKDRA
jgi:hypothetical protein